MRSAFVILILTAFTIAVSCGSQVESPEDGVTGNVSTRHSYIRDSSATVDTLDLIFYLPVNSYPAITTTRPLKSDTNVVFVCAAAFTLLENDAIDGLFIDSGKIQIKWVNHSLGGGIVIPERSSTLLPTIFGTEMGDKLDSAFKDSISAMHASFFQQIQLVRDGQALRFQKEFSRFQRRALCILNNQIVVVETKAPCTMQNFANVLKSCGIKNALYVDMGSWDEGWYRTMNNEQTTIGLMRSQTGRQSNWFVFRGN